MPWTAVKLEKNFNVNMPEAALRGGQAALENVFINESGGHSRFPGLRLFSTLSGSAPTYLHDWRDNLIAVTNGQAYRIKKTGEAENVTGTAVAGGRRVSFARTPDFLIMAAGKQIIRFGGGVTEPLADNTPDATHVAYLEGYTLAVETRSQTFWHSEPGDELSWSDLDSFAADADADDIEAMVVTPFREVILAGKRSVEQFERLSSGESPFFRRWSSGEGIRSGDTLIFCDNAVWYVNSLSEFVKSAGQVPQDTTKDIGYSLELIDDWNGAWAARCHIRGQKFILLQMPNASTEYETKGVTFLYDYRYKRWSQLYGWDADEGQPRRWPGWSIHRLWGRWFVGGNGKVYELDDTMFTNDGEIARVLGRTGHIHDKGETRIDNLRVRVKRGDIGSSGLNNSSTFDNACFVNTGEGPRHPMIGIRARRDNQRWTRWRWKSMGLYGNRHMFLEFGPMGVAHTWQFEYAITDPVSAEVVAMDVYTTSVDT